MVALARTTRPSDVSVADRIRVLQVAARYLPDLGGIETHVHEVATRLSAMPNVRVAVAATDREGTHPAIDITEDFPVIRRRAWPKTRDYYLAPGLAPVITRSNWDIVHVQGVHTLVPVVAMLAARRAGLPYVVTCHTGGSSSSLRSAARNTQWRALGPLLRGAAQLIAVSPFEQRMFARATGIAHHRIMVVPNGGTLPGYRTSEPTPGQIVSCGRLERYKGHHRVIEALPYVLKTFPEAHLRILGAGPYEGQLRALASRLGVESSVSIRLVPPGDRASMARALSEAAVMAAFSDYEAHPVAVMEAVALGVPVVGYDTAGVGDLVAQGWVQGIKPDCPPQLAANALNSAMRLRPAAPAHLPTWDAAAEALAMLYRSVVLHRPIGGKDAPRLGLVASAAS